MTSQVDLLAGTSTGRLAKQLSDFDFARLTRPQLEATTQLLAGFTRMVCPRCLSRKLLELSSMNLKICSDCNLRIEWKLSPRGKSL